MKEQLVVQAIEQRRYTQKQMSRKKVAMEKKIARAENTGSSTGSLFRKINGFADEKSATILEDNVVLLSSDFILPGPVTDRGAVVVKPIDVFKMLLPGSLLNENVVQGYINMLGRAFGPSLGVRVVSTTFHSILCRDGSMAGVT
jgi:hypothetical protein